MVFELCERTDERTDKETGGVKYKAVSDVVFSQDPNADSSHVTTPKNTQLQLLHGF